MDPYEEAKKLQLEFKDCQKLLIALGDETRQHLLSIMMRGECSGSRVIEIAEKTNLSRPAVSHHMQLILDEPNAFGKSKLASYGKFVQVKNYIVLSGKKEKGLEERCGYYGEKVVLEAQKMGLNTCWVAGIYSKSQAKGFAKEGEKLVAVIAIGYGTEAGKKHKSKSYEEVTKVKETPPEWFVHGVEAALLAPTAMNQQKFLFTLVGEKVLAKALFGPYSKLDLGIVKYHFEIGSGKQQKQRMIFV